MLQAAGVDSGPPARACSRAWSARRRRATVRPAARSRAGSATTSISRVSLARTSTCPTPGHARERRPHDVEGVVVEIGGRTAPPVRLRMRIGKGGRGQALDGQIGLGRQRSPRNSAILPCTCCSARIMSVDGIELRRDLGGAAERRRAHAADARDLHHAPARSDG